MKKIFVKSVAVLSAMMLLCGCEITAEPYNPDSTGSDYSINIVDKSDVTDAPEVQTTEASAVTETEVPAAEDIQEETTEVPTEAPTEISTEYYAEVTEEPEYTYDDFSDDTYVEYYFRTENQLDQHFTKHGYEFEGDFDYETAEEYEIGASDVINNPDALYKTEAEDGDHVYYIEETNEFVVLSKDGYIRTYFRPNAGIDYFNRQ